MKRRAGKDLQAHGKRRKDKEKGEPVLALLAGPLGGAARSLKGRPCRRWGRRQNIATQIG